MPHVPTTAHRKSLNSAAPSDPRLELAALRPLVSFSATFPRPVARDCFYELGVPF